jgi:hypothetical protein
MNRKYLILSMIVAGAAASLASRAHAQYLDVTLNNNDPTVTQGTTVVGFSATVLNPSATQTFYLNGDSNTTSSPFLTVDDSPYYAPSSLASLAPGQSEQILLFNVDLSPSTTAGTYAGNDFQILGDTGTAGVGGAIDEIVNVLFSVKVSAPVSVGAPEMDPDSAFGALTFLSGCILVLRAGKKATAPERR